MSFSHYDNPFLSPLLGDKEIADLFSPEADIKTMLLFEQGLVFVQAEFGLIPQAAAKAIDKAFETFEPQFEGLIEGVKRDGLMVPELVKQLRGHIGEKFGKYVHLGATSQDVIDSSLMVRTAQAFKILIDRTEKTLKSYEALINQFGKNRLIARTRMQRALPITVQDRIRSWAYNLEIARDKIVGCKLPVQFGGPVGTLKEFGDNAIAMRTLLGVRLGIGAPNGNWHNARGPVVSVAEACSHITGTLGKLGIDVCLMAQNELGEITLLSGGGSSAMAHKQNPVKAEALVTLARFNATLISGMHQALVHEQERSGAAWTLEWMILPQMIVATGAATRIANELLSSITAMGTAP